MEGCQGNGEEVRRGCRRKIMSGGEPWEWRGGVTEEDVLGEWRGGETGVQEEDYVRRDAMGVARRCDRVRCVRRMARTSDGSEGGRLWRGARGMARTSDGGAGGRLCQEGCHWNGEEVQQGCRSQEG